MNYKEPTPPGEELVVRSQIVKVKDTPGVVGSAKSLVQVDLSLHLVSCVVRSSRRECKLGAVLVLRTCTWQRTQMLCTGVLEQMSVSLPPAAFACTLECRKGFFCCWPCGATDSHLHRVVAAFRVT